MAYFLCTPEGRRADCGVTMRTTLDLPESLVADAMKISHQRTKTAVIITALQDLVRKNRLHELRRFKGRVPIELDLMAVRKRA